MNRYDSGYNNDKYYEPEDDEDFDEDECGLDETDFIDEDEWERDDD
jgi:hypothetical protein